jgi:hypothetical protein
LRRRVFRLILLVLFAAGGLAHAQDKTERLPEDYAEEEFSQAARNLRRAEIILVGSFPLTAFLSLEVYDFYRFAHHDWDVAYAPWPVRPPTAAEYSNAESVGVLVAAISLSAVLAIADYAIGRIRERRAEDPRRHDR